MLDQALIDDVYPIKTCCRPTCDRKHYGRGLCKRHYQQAWYKSHPSARARPVLGGRAGSQGRSQALSPQEPILNLPHNQAPRPVPSGMPWHKSTFDPDRARFRAGEDL
jgi:hypothetical protein